MKSRRAGMLPALAGLLIASSVAASGCTTVAESPGQIELSAAEFNFGTIPDTDPVSHVLQVRNVGGKELEITAVSTSCACTTAEVESRHLAPGADTDLTVTYDPQVHGGAAGEFMRLVYVRSNDPDTPEASLTIWVTVIGPDTSSETARSKESAPRQAAQADAPQPTPELAANEVGRTGPKRLGASGV